MTTKKQPPEIAREALIQLNRPLNFPLTPPATEL